MRSDSQRGQIDLLQVVTLVLWLTCLFVWLIDHFASDKPPAPLAPTTQQTEAVFVDVALTDSSPAPPTELPPLAPVSPPLPALPAVVPFSAAIAFATPTPGPAHLASGPTRAKSPVYQQIFYGRGEGNQPKPEYPFEAEVAGQTGTVGVEFVVSTDGSVSSTRVSNPCQWPLLNQAAERSIRQSWTYPHGPIRHYRVSIVYAQKPN